MNAENNQSNPETIAETSNVQATVDVQPEATSETPTPKKRGRKKGSTNKPKDAPGVPDQSTPKKRGRKKATAAPVASEDSTPKKRGRKKAAPAPVVSDDSAPKKRGRKKGATSTVADKRIVPVTKLSKKATVNGKKVRTSITKIPTKRELIKLQKEHRTDSAIAKAVGLNDRVIFNLRKKYGIISSYAKNEARNVDIRKKKEKGWKAEKLAAKFGLSICQIYKVLKKGN